jgi:hypothetical protein
VAQVALAALAALVVLPQVALAAPVVLPQVALAALVVLPQVAQVAQVGKRAAPMPALTSQSAIRRSCMHGWSRPSTTMALWPASR